MKKLIVVCAVLIFYAFVVLPARADQRNYVWTYEYGTVAKGNAEIEFYQTAVTKDKDVRSASDWTQQLELEYGITDHLDAGIYQVYEQAADSGAMTYGGFKLKARYRVAEKNELPLDVLFYAEHSESTTGENAFEGKVVLAKDIGRVNFAYNQIFERTYSAGKGEHEYAAGVSYELAPWIHLGIESKGSFTEGEFAAGPTIAWIGNRIWANLGAQYGLNSKTNDREVRFLLGIPF
ncbi:MAG: hypothetical protein ACYC7L_03725 [Nitrospirota bacterium]